MEKIKYCNGIIGVPITFMDKYNKDNFEIIDMIRPKLNGKNKYCRILIKRKPFVIFDEKTNKVITNLIKNELEIQIIDNNDSKIDDMNSTQLSDEEYYIISLKEYLDKNPELTVNDFLIRRVDISTNKAYDVFLYIYQQFNEI